MKLSQRLAGNLLFTAAIAGITPLTANAITYAESEHLNTAYPPGSVILCMSELPGDGKGRLPTTIAIRAEVNAREGNHTVYDASVSWLTQGSTTANLTLSYRMTQRSDEKGQYAKIDPDSMSVSMPGATAENEKTVLQGFRQQFTADESFTPYSQIEITDFPSYISRNPGEPPTYCHKEQDKSA